MSMHLSLNLFRNRKHYTRIRNTYLIIYLYHKLMKASDLFIKCLEAEKIEYIFGLPGEENADLMISLDNSPSIRFVISST